MYEIAMPDTDRMSREELLEARAKIENQLSELSYSAVIGGTSASPKSAVRKRLLQILAEINRELED